MTTETNGLKPRTANLIVIFAEIAIMVLYFVLGWKGIKKIFELDFAGAFDSVLGAIWFLNITILALTLCILLIKPLRTPANKRRVIWNLLWIGSNIYMMYS